MHTCIRKTGWKKIWVAGVALASITAIASPRSAQAEYFLDMLVGSDEVARPTVGSSKNGLVSYNTTPRSWAHLPATVYASVPTVGERYPVYPQRVVAGMPVQMSPVRPVVVQTRPAGVYGGVSE